jgi:tRNA/tmRNA/rRNA uracil-C5-methylase (TrmA/RlmC/RlmD family)
MNSALQKRIYLSRNVTNRMKRLVPYRIVYIRAHPESYSLDTRILVDTYDSFSKLNDWSMFLDTQLSSFL